MIVPKKTTSKLKTRTVQGTGMQGTPTKSGKLVIIVLACKITIIIWLIAIKFYGQASLAHNTKQLITISSSSLFDKLMHVSVLRWYILSQSVP